MVSSQAEFKKKTVINKLECNASNMKQTTNKKSVLWC